jgi:response regulator RpfG family c-di-GMP phosphodiesterase
MVFFLNQLKASLLSKKLENISSSRKEIMPAPSNIKILLLEDIESLRVQMVSDLKSLGFSGDVYEAPDLKTAVQFCKDKEFDFIISDWNLPDGTGLDFLMKIKKMFLSFLKFHF